MNAATPAAVLAKPSTSYQSIPLASITPSTTNPRKRFDEAALKELTSSVRAHGVVQPVLVRPAGAGKFELVVGERRFRAAKAAGLEEIPANVRELADVDVLEIQIIENLQRADVHPIEEAEGYERLMQQVRPGSAEKYSAEDIAAKVGKSRTYVFNRLKLLDLCQEGRKAYFDGVIDQTKAQMIARIGHPDTQKAALKAIIDAGDSMPSRAAHDYIVRNYMLDLRTAVFDIKVADYTAKGKVIAGPCGSCPKRSGNNQDLFGDISNKDTCTDVKCFHAKRAAFHDRREEELRAKGAKVVTGNEAKKILTSSYSTTVTSEPFVSGNARPPGSDKTYQQLLGKKLESVMVRRPDSDELVPVYPSKDAQAALKEKGVTPSKLQGPLQKAAAAEQNKADLDAKYRRECYLAVREKLAAGLSEPEWRRLVKIFAEDFMEMYDFPHFIRDTYTPGLTEEVDCDELMSALNDTLDKLPVLELPRFMFDVVHSHFARHGFGNEELVRFADDMATRHKVDKKAIRARVQAEAKAAAKGAK